MFSTDSFIDKQKNIISKKINDEYILVPLSGNIANMKSLFTLNETAAFLWEKIDGNKNVDQLAQEVVKEFDIEFNEALLDIRTFLSEINSLLIIK